ncbi:hypothetical protein EYF80_048307 [Liparis tanakae]|uniref:Uncharacterized protein n=1 Tax=Liparis tanakae TaxID=230148 RepID=A0A4Z2FJY0_9TELE|nr:hypothetical protein EYF80_048307 [Liparis tanakae]
MWMGLSLCIPCLIVSELVAHGASVGPLANRLTAIRSLPDTHTGTQEHLVTTDADWITQRL